MSLTLYYAPGSSAFAAMVALEEARAEYDTRLVNLANGDQHKSDFLAINPHGKVPVLTVGSSIVAENIGVLTYISANFPEAKLLPYGDALALAQAYALLSWFSTGVHIEIAKIFRGDRFTTDEQAKSLIKHSGIEKFGQALVELEAIAAGSGDWLCGSQFSVIDAFGLVIWR